MKKVLSTITLILFALFSYAQSANIKVVDVEHNKIINGYKGLLIHSHILVNGMKNGTINVVAFVYLGNNGANGKLLGGLNGFKTNDGQVCTFSNSNCLYDNTEWQDFKLFLPYDAITTGAGTTQLSLQAEVRNLSNWQSLAQSEFINFTITKNNSYNPQYPNYNTGITPYRQQSICPYCNGKGYKCKVVPTYGTQATYTCPNCHKRTRCHHIYQKCTMCHGIGSI